MSTLDVNSTVGQWVVEYPRTARVFEDCQIDYCCGGGTSLADACAKNSLDVKKVMAELTLVVANPEPEPERDWSESSLTELCDHIQQTHHAYLRGELPRLEAIMEKVAAAHGEAHPETNEVKKLFAELRAELEPHMFKEEQILFPAIRAMEAASSRPLFPFGTVANPIRMMEHEHDAVGDALARLRTLTKDFRVPDDACNTYRVMLDGLKQLEADLHTHIHKENNILFPRAQTLENTFATETNGSARPLSSQTIAPQTR